MYAGQEPHMNGYAQPNGGYMQPQQQTTGYGPPQQQTTGYTMQQNGFNQPTGGYAMMNGQPQQQTTGYPGQQQQQQMPQQMQQANAWAGQRFQGTIKSYSESNGYGFIGGPEILAALGKDVFLHQRDVTEVTGVARPQVPCGVTVSFAITINPKGQPQARDVRFEETSMMQMQQAGDSVQASMGGQQQQQGHMNFQNQYVQAGKRFKGFVKSFSQVNGFGFVGGDDIIATFGKDVFLHFRELQGLMGVEKPSLPSGTWLTFTATMNQKGQPQARDVQFEPGQTGLPYPQGQQQQQFDPMAQHMSQMTAQMGGAAAVAALDLQPQTALNSTVTHTMPTISDADAYARVQADIEKFQREVLAQREAAAKEDGGATRRSRSRKRSRARSGRRDSRR